MFYPFVALLWKEQQRFWSQLGLSIQVLELFLLNLSGLEGYFPQNPCREHVTSVEDFKGTCYCNIFQLVLHSLHVALHTNSSGHSNSVATSSEVAWSEKLDGSLGSDSAKSESVRRICVVNFRHMEALYIHG